MEAVVAQAAGYSPSELDDALVSMPVLNGMLAGEART